MTVREVAPNDLLRRRWPRPPGPDPQHRYVVYADIPDQRHDWYVGVASAGFFTGWTNTFGAARFTAAEAAQFVAEEQDYLTTWPLRVKEVEQ